MCSNEWWDDGIEIMVSDLRSGQNSMSSSRLLPKHGSHSLTSGEIKIDHVQSAKISVGISNTGSLRCFQRLFLRYLSSNSHVGQILFLIFRIFDLECSSEFQISDLIFLRFDSQISHWFDSQICQQHLSRSGSISISQHLRTCRISQISHRFRKLNFRIFRLLQSFRSSLVPFQSV